MEEFAAPLDVSPPAVRKWEKKGEAPTGMTTGTEFQIRARIVRELQESEEISENLRFADIFDEIFEFNPDLEFEQVELDWSREVTPVNLPSRRNSYARGSH